MKKILLVLTFLIVAGLIVRSVIGGQEDTWNCKGGVWVKHGNPKDPAPQKICLTYFWGDGCPHCKNVDSFLNSWENKDKIALDKNEVWYNKKNNQLMQEAYKKCGIEAKDMGVPLLITPKSECLTGDTPIIEYFKGL